MKHIIFTVACFAFTNIATAAEPAAWNQWRGPSRDGVLKDAKPWPESFKDFEPVWTVDNLGPSYSGTIVTADRVFTTETVAKKTERVTAYDRKTGKLLWKAEWEGSISVPFFAAANGSWIRATPAFDGERLYVAGIKDLLVCLDGKTGKELWKYDFVKEQKSEAPTFGFVSSPLVDDKAVYVQAGGGFAKLDKLTGKMQWLTLKDGGGMNGSAFSTPVFAKLGDADQILVQTRTKMAGVNPESGKELWTKEIKSFRGMNILTPVVFGDTVFTSTYGGNTQGFKVLGSSGGLRTEDAWNFKYEGNMSTPVVVDNHAYYLGKDQRAICVNLKDGKEAWRSEKRFGKYWNLVANGDKILALDERGILYLLKANPKDLDILAEKKLPRAETWAHLAVYGDEIAIRDLSSLTLYRWK
jgi:outer membrane protein assembly factor BamB